MEVITLQCPDEVIVDTGNDLLFDAGIFYLVDRAHRKSVDLFDRQGGYIGSVQAFGRSGAEYAGISGVQPVDLLVAVYSYHNQALYCYDRQGRFVRRDSLAYGPLDLLKVSDGYWGYAGYSNTVPSRVVRMDPQGTITREYLPTANIIPLSETSSVFVPHDGDLFIREVLQRRIFRIDAAGELSTFLTFDFGRWNIPDTYFESDDPMQAAQKLMTSDFAPHEPLYDQRRLHRGGGRLQPQFRQRHPSAASASDTAARGAGCVPTRRARGHSSSPRPGR